VRAYIFVGYQRLRVLGLTYTPSDTGPNAYHRTSSGSYRIPMATADLIIIAFFFFLHHPVAHTRARAYTRLHAKAHTYAYTRAGTE